MNTRICFVEDILILRLSHLFFRNAALQLYGALVPKLVGQKKPSGTETESLSTVACDELKTHFPKLWTYIMEILQGREQTNLLVTHSNFVPILNMLANTAKRYKFSYDIDGTHWEKQLLFSLVTLLGSPINTVRRLSAKCIFNIYSFDDIYDVIFHLEDMTENLLHGTLTLVEISHRYYCLKHHQQFKILQQKFRQMLTSGSHCYSSKDIFENVFYTISLDEKEIFKILLEVCHNKQTPCIFQWANNRVKKIIMTCQWEQIPGMLKTILSQSESELYCEFIYEKLEVDTGLSETVVNEVVQTMVSFGNNKSNGLVWKILYKLSLKFDFNHLFDLENLMKSLTNKDIYKLRYMIPLIATNILTADEVHQKQFIALVSKLSDFDNVDVDMRYISVIANNEIAKAFKNLNDFVRVTSIKIAVVFLQDEDDNVRSLATYFYKNLITEHSAVHAYICLNKILDPKFLVTLFDSPKTAIEKLCQDLDVVLAHNICCNFDEYNPFANDVKNIYLEAEQLRKLIFKLKNTIS